MVVVVDTGVGLPEHQVPFGLWQDACGTFKSFEAQEEHISAAGILDEGKGYQQQNGVGSEVVVAVLSGVADVVVVVLPAVDVLVVASVAVVVVLVVVSVVVVTCASVVLASVVP